MTSRNHLSLTGVVAKLEPVQKRCGVRFYLVHNYGGGNPPLFLPCVFLQEATLENGERLRIEAHLRAINGKPTAYVNKAVSI
jgi:hypothetical protein